ncbi:hypothetical protein O6H91_18G063600 [Diphasiastrum complanatum]|uniref:Uncharacterized protein n=1 Tax=Diphasiastrum complanatum TaxID=34168 RepID=A0ACC2B1X2_DIPCM|nr:hypothetical protein O6H91_Y206300 [Diphasiastrum complanatum]KAJ7523813.1 hypothetical protein O6H91_18G063600 [Diphasiastrum complanatum]
MLDRRDEVSTEEETSRSRSRSRSRSSWSTCCCCRWIGAHCADVSSAKEKRLAYVSANDSVPMECQRSCGAIDIPYPFEITPGCGLQGFSINCSMGNISSLIIASQDIQILEISAGAMIIDATGLKAYSCVTGSETNTTTAMSLGDLTPFVFSGGNRFYATGCNVSGGFATDISSGISMCNTSCLQNQPTSPLCDMPGCCILKIPSGSRKLSVEAQKTKVNESGCGYASVVYPPTYSMNGQGIAKNGKLGIQLLWAIPDRSCENVIGRAEYACSSNASCVDVLDVPGYICECNRHGFAGNGYMDGSGCSDINECAELTSNMCAPDADCINTLGSYTCHCLEGFYGDGYVNGTGCVSRNAKFSQTILLGCLGGAAFLVAITSFMFWKYRFKYLEPK